MLRSIPTPRFGEIMEDMTVTPSRYDFGPVHAALRHYIDSELLPGVSHAVLRGRNLMDVGCFGWADRELDRRIEIDTLFRVFSNTKLVTSCAVLLLVEEDRVHLDDPIEHYIPQLANRVVLRPGATTIDDVEPARGPITIRHLMSHSSGLSYGLLDPGTLMFQAYTARRVLNPATPLSAMIDTLSDLPLAFHPGTSWEYSVATDVLSRFVEIVSGARFDEFIRSRILDPLGMADTSFYVPENKRDRFAALYQGPDLIDPLKPGLTRNDSFPYRNAYLAPVPRLSGGGGLVSTLPDMVALLRSLLPGGKKLLKPETSTLLMTNQLPSGVTVQFPLFGKIAGKGYGVAGALTIERSKVEPPDAVGELEWGGLAGTHWWISPRTGTAAVIMTQRYFGFWHPFAFEFKRLVYGALG